MSRNFQLPITGALRTTSCRNPDSRDDRSRVCPLGLDWRCITLEGAGGDIGAAVRGPRFGDRSDQRRARRHYGVHRRPGGAHRDHRRGRGAGSSRRPCPCSEGLGEREPSCGAYRICRTGSPTPGGQEVITALLLGIHEDARVRAAVHQYLSERLSGLRRSSGSSGRRWSTCWPPTIARTPAALWTVEGRGRANWTELSQ